MSTPRFYIAPLNWNLDRLALEGDEAHHCLDVLRMGVGERVVVFDGRGREATCEIGEVAKKNHVGLRRLQHAQTPPLACEVVLGQAVPKGKNMELIIEKATELGAAGIVPLLSERTVVRYDAEEISRKKEKWQRVAIEAAKQCGQNWVPEVAAPVPMKAFFDGAPRFDLMLIASLQPDARPLKSVLAGLQAEAAAPTFRAPVLRRVLILVGPEGEFTPAEVGLAKSGGCRPITLGPIILRTETAALYCLSVLAHELFVPVVR